MNEKDQNEILVEGGSKLGLPKDSLDKSVREIDRARVPAHSHFDDRKDSNQAPRHHRVIGRRVILLKITAHAVLSLELAYHSIGISLATKLARSGKDTSAGFIRENFIPSFF